MCALEAEREGGRERHREKMKIERERDKPAR